MSQVLSQGQALASDSFASALASSSCSGRSGSSSHGGVLLCAVKFMSEIDA